MNKGRKAAFHQKEHTWQSGSKNGKLEPETPAAQPSHPSPKCPSCHSNRAWKDGLRYTENGDIQRYICRECGSRFSETTSKTSERLQKIHTKSLKRLQAILLDRQICVSEGEMKNLAKVETRQKRAAGATTQAEIKGRIIELGVRMLNNGYAEKSVKTTISILMMLAKRATNLLDPECVKATIAKQAWKPSTKKAFVVAYAHLLEYMGLTWDKPRYKVPKTLPFVPLEEEVDQLIAALPKKASTFVQTIKETGARPGEIKGRLKWTDINRESRAIIIRVPEKGGNARVLDVSQNLIDRLEQLPKTSEIVFPSTMKVFYISFGKQKRRIAAKLNNPRIANITLCSLRHLKGTMEYHRTRDILYVKKILGHQNINNTLIYIDLEHAIFRTKNDQFTVRVAKTVEEACQLVEVGFEYVTGDYTDGGKIFRKRK